MEPGVGRKTPVEGHVARRTVRRWPVAQSRRRAVDTAGVTRVRWAAGVDDIIRVRGGDPASLADRAVVTLQAMYKQ